MTIFGEAQMRVAIVLDCYFDTGNGTSVSARNDVRELLKRGVDVTVLCAKSGSRNPVGDEKIVEFDVLRVPIFQKAIEKQHAQLARPNEGKVYLALSEVDVVHIYLPMFLGNCCVEMARTLHIPVLGCYHMSAQNLTYNVHMSKVPFATALTYGVLKRVHYKFKAMKDIYCPSSDIARVLLAHGYRQNLHIISNGYDPCFEKNSEGYANSKYVICGVGRYVKEKRQDLIVRAVGFSKYRDKIELHLAGCGIRDTYYVQLAERFGVDLTEEYLDRQNLQKLLNGSYLYIQASDAETEGVACLEAMACGAVPIISNARMCATKQFALREESIFEHGSAKSLAKRIDWWIEHLTERNKMSAEYAEYAKKFSLERHIDSLMRVYENMMSRGEKSRYVVQDFNGNMKLEFVLEGKSPRPSRKHLRLCKKLLKPAKKEVHRKKK